MIRAEFFQSHGSLKGFVVSGHALFDDAGQDIVCAAVSSAVQFTCNGITEVLHYASDLTVSENRISLRLPDNSLPAEPFLEALNLHLDLLTEEYPGTIQVIHTEV